MSYHTFFDFASGIAKPMTVPKGTKDSIVRHVTEVERTLGLKTVQYEKGTPHWDPWAMDLSGIADEILCRTVSQHNQWVRYFYADLARWSKEPPADGELLTPEDAQTFWQGLEQLDVPPSRWTREYYKERMETLYEVMRGRETAGITFDTKALTTKQAAAVIRLFAEFLDTGDLRLDVPVGFDYLASSYDGGYAWCEKCGPMNDSGRSFCRKRQCPLREDD